MKKNTSTAAVITAASLFLTGSTSVNSDVSSDYVASILDASYKGDITYYMSMTESTEEEAKEIYDSTVNYFTESLAYYCEVYLEDISEELNAEFTSVTADLLSKAKYTVASAENGKESCYVKISIKPLNILDQLDPMVEACINDYNAKLEEIGVEGLDTMSDEQYTALETDYAESILDALKSCVAAPEYKENIDFTIEIIIDEDDYYAPANENDWNTIDDYVMGLYE